MANTPTLACSPTRLALRRLLRHRLALAGAALLALVVLVVLAGGWGVEGRADETRLWLGAQPPGCRQPLCRTETRFATGAPPDLPKSLRACRTLAYDLQTVVRREVRVTVRRDVIASLTAGAEALAELDLARLPAPAHELGADGKLGRVLPQVRLVPGAAPPPELLAPDQRVLILAWDEPGPPTTVTVTLDRGLVAGLTQTAAGQTAALPELTVRGPDVRAVRGDGRPRELVHWLGTDELGRDLLLRVVTGGRISLLVGLVATLVSLVGGVAWGALAGYVGGRTDEVMMRLVDVLYGLPFIFLVLLLMVLFDRSLFLLFAALGLVQWLTMARVIRGQMLTLRELEFCEAARLGGASDLRIVFVHLVPHTFGPMVVYATLTVPVVILEESFLAFIGLPVQYANATLDSWGSLVNLGMAALGERGEHWWLVSFPAAAMVATLFGLNCLGDGLRDSFDPKGGG